MAGGKDVEISKPVLEYLIVNLKKSGITDIIICTSLGNKIREYFAGGGQFGVHIVYSHEKNPLLTGGALLKVKNHLDHKPFLVVYGDILTNLPFSDLVDFHEAHKTLATIALTTVAKPENYGQLQLHGITLVNFYQKNENKTVKSNLINCGIYIFEPEIFDYLPKGSQPFLLETVIEKLIREKKVNGFVFEEQWIDVGKKPKINPYPGQKSLR